MNWLSVHPEFGKRQKDSYWLFLWRSVSMSNHLQLFNLLVPQCLPSTTCTCMYFINKIFFSVANFVARHYFCPNCYMYLIIINKFIWPPLKRKSTGTAAGCFDAVKNELKVSIRAVRLSRVSGISPCTVSLSACPQHRFPY